MDILQSLFGLDDRVAVVTGGASGLGAAFSTRSGGAGAEIVIADINERTGGRGRRRDQAAAAARPSSANVDVTDVAVVEAFADAVVEAHGHVDVLDQQRRRCAPIAHRGASARLPYDRILALNLKGTYFMSQAIGRKMLEQGKGASSTSRRSADSSPTRTRARTWQQGRRRPGNEVVRARVVRAGARQRDCARPR